VAVNGQLIPRFDAAPGEVQRWRFVDGSWDVPQYLSWYEADGITPTPDISMYEIALDGLATGGLKQVSPMIIAPDNGPISWSRRRCFLRRSEDVLPDASGL